MKNYNVSVSFFQPILKNVVKTDFHITKPNAVEAMSAALAIMETMHDLDMFPPSQKDLNCETFVDVKPISYLHDTEKDLSGDDPIDKLIDVMHNDYGLYWYTGPAQLSLPL